MKYTVRTHAATNGFPLVMAFLAYALAFSAVAIVYADAVPTVSLAPIASQSVTVGDTVSFSASASDSDASGTIAYALAGAPTGASIDPSSGAFSWNTTGAAPDTYTFSVTATGSTGGSATGSVSITANAAIAATSTDATTTDTGATTTPLDASSTQDTASSTPDVSASTTPDNASTALDASSTLDSSASTTPVQSQDATSTQGTGGVATTTGGVINTGDAAASTTVDNALNTDATNPDQPGKTNSSTITASSTSDGSLDSAATSTATTGGNSSLGGDGNNSITTGNAVSTANVINELNTNIFNSDGLIIFLNQLFGGGIDLNTYDLSFFLNGGPGASPTSVAGTTTPQCTLLTCLNSSSLNVLDTNDATVTNTVIVRSATGGNTASSTGDSMIQTGAAYAAANVLNLVNTNIVNSSYLLVSFNNFGDLADNITLPSAGFFSQLLQHGSMTPQMNSSSYTVANDNVGTTTGSVVADAQSGNNTSSSTATGTGNVTTGGAYTSASTYNQANTNNVGGTSVFMLFRVWGTFTGSINDLPAGLVATTTPDGIEIVSSDSPASALQALGKFNSSSFLMSATNTAAVDNNVNVSASTGDNRSTTDTGTSTVRTGSAYAAASVVNLVNTNIVGQNWIFAVFNIFGNFSGNIDFGGGSPTLAIKAIPAPSTTGPNSDVTYTFTISNTGNADATDVVLNASFDKSILSFDSGGDYGASATALGESWDLGSILEGQTRTFAVTGHIGGIAAGTSVSVPLTATVLNNAITTPTPSNTANTSVIVSSPLPAGSGGGGGGGAAPVGLMGGGGGGGSAYNTTNDPAITITKTTDVSSAIAPAEVNYKVVVDNSDNAGPAYNAILTDTLTDPSGATMYTRSWDLATVNPGDEITLTYAVAYATSTQPGVYHNVATLTGQKNYPGNALSTLASASGDVTFLSNGTAFDDSTSTPQISTSTVALASSTLDAALNADPSLASCSPLLVNYLGIGLHNTSSEVVRLQGFLNEQGASLPLTGFFGPMTSGAVKDFQRTYAADILTPLGIAQPTGYVYSSTLRKINELACDGAPVSYVAPVQNIVPHAGLSALVPKTPKVQHSQIAKTSQTASAAATLLSVGKNSHGWVNSLFDLFSL